MFINETYQDPESDGYELLQSLNATTVTPIMARHPRIGGTFQLFMVRKNFYLWNIIEGTTRRFKEKDITTTLQSMTENEGEPKNFS